MFELARPWVCIGCATSIARGARYGELASRRTYTTNPPAQDGRPFRMAVIGSGPAGFYTAYKVMAKIREAKVDMYEQLPVPYGLVRFGVAPDHPEVKNCQEKFEEVAESPDFNFVGNISIGDGSGELPLKTLVPHYDVILFAYGASRDRTLGIPGEDLTGIYSARAFVGWYNGLPEYADLAPDLTQGEEAVVIGQGNVALDVARILLQDPNTLRPTDITSHAIETLEKSTIKRVRVFGRRGPLQAAFTIKEARELMKLPSVAFHPINEALLPADIANLPRAPRRIMEILKKGTNLPVSSVEKSWSLDFCLSPTEFTSTTESLSRLGNVSFERTSLGSDPFDPAAKAHGTGELINIPAEMAFRSIGYKSEALPGFLELGIPFDNRLGIIPNDGMGRAVIPSGLDEGIMQILPGLYCAGWVKRGPTGVIASTMNDAFLTAEAIAGDWHSPTAHKRGESTGLGWKGVQDEAKKRGCRRVSWQDWQKIDAAEKSKGQSKGKQREKFTRIEDMLAVLD